MNPTYNLNLSKDENIREEFVNVLQNEDFRKQFAELYKTKLKSSPSYKKQILDYSRISGAYWWKYKYLIGWYSRYQQVETWKRFIDALKNSWINVIEIK